jgi:hypothetical protein
LSAARGRVCALVALIACAGSGAKVAPKAPPAPAAQGEGSGAEPDICPRVERAKRMWSGFLVDVPSEAMVQALDVVVPIQVALGKIFCAEQLHDCRPSALIAIELTDAAASEAQVRVRLDRPAGARELPLVLHPVAPAQEGEAAWRSEPASLADYLTRCRAPGSDERDAGH